MQKQQYTLWLLVQLRFSFSLVISLYLFCTLLCCITVIFLFRIYQYKSEFSISICRMFFLLFLEIQITGYFPKTTAIFPGLILSSSLVVIFTIPPMIQWSNYCMYLTYFIWYEYYIFYFLLLFHSLKNTR